MKTINVIFVCVLGAAAAAAQDDKAAALAAARALPDGPQKEAILKALNAAPAPAAALTEQPSLYDELGVDHNEEWQNTELKKAQIAQIFAALDEMPLKDGRRVKISSITAVTPKGLRWIGAGIEEAHWSLLPDPFIAAFGFTQARQSAYEAWRKQADIAGAAAVAAKNRQVQEQSKAALAQKDSDEQAMKEALATRVAVSLRVSQATQRGGLCYGRRIESSPLWGRWEGLQWVNGLAVAEEHDEPIFVLGLPADTVDGARLAGWLYPCGVHRYTTVRGSEKTVRKYATTPQRALAEKAGGD